MSQLVTLKGAWLPSDPDVGSNRLLSFEVPPGTVRLDLHYSVQPAQGSGEPKLDVGLFDPAGTAFLKPNGFRGWSGAFRNELFIAENVATPGYAYGRTAPGTWHVLIGADAPMLGTTGLRYTIEIILSSEGEDQASRGEEVHAETPLPMEPGGPQPAPVRHAWYRGNLHSHTYYSDGANSIAEVADEHIRRGLQFGALTEHNVVNPDLEEGRRPGFVWLPAEEVTTYRGHLNAWGLSQWLDFRCTTEDEMQQVIDAAHAQGAVTSINHPKDDGPPWEFDLFTADCVEVWQAPWFLGNFQSLALWERLLREGKRLVAVGGSDLHRIGTPEHPYPYNLDNPTTWVRAPGLSVAGILEGIGRGHVFISRDSAGPELYLVAEGGLGTAIMGDSVPLVADEGLTVRAEVRGGASLILRLLTQNGVVHQAPVLSSDFEAEYIWSEAGAEAARGPAYIRAELIREPDVSLEEEPDAIWVEAMTNPIYAMPAAPAPAAARAVVEKQAPVALSPLR